MDTRDAVRRFVVHARDLAGRAEELARVMEPFYGELPAVPTINAWAAGRNEPLARALFAMAQAVPGLSLDEFAMAHAEQRGLLEQLQALRQQVEQMETRMAVLQERLGEVLDDRGMAPLEFPGA